MFVAVARITLAIPEAGSLKSKRQIVHKVIDKVKARFNVSISEVDDQDLWQKATLGVAVVANDHAFAQENVDKAARYIEELYVAPVISCATEVVPLGDELYGDGDGSSFGAASRIGEASRGAHRTLAEAEYDEAVRAGREPPAFARSPPPSGGGGSGGRGRGARRERRMSEGERVRALEDLRRRLREERARAAAGDDDEES